MAGGSVRENNADVQAFVVEHDIKTALDVGPGYGTYHRMLGDLIPTMDAVEAWEKYIRRHRLRARYRMVHHCDIRDYTAGFDYDLIIFGDILEHLSRDDAMTVWARAAEQARYGLISVPTVHYPQGAIGGNPFEIHKQEDLTPDEIRRDYGPFVLDKVYEITSTFIRKF